MPNRFYFPDIGASSSVKAVIPAIDRDTIAQAGDRIIRLYENWGKSEKAAEWRLRLQTPGRPPSSSSDSQP